MIFHSNESYRVIKEKVIGLTVNYEPELKPIFTALIDEYIKTELLKSEAVYDIYVYYENMKDDYGHLKEICDGVKALDTSPWGDVKKAYQVWIINDINRYLERIRPDEGVV